MHTCDAELVMPTSSVSCLCHNGSAEDDCAKVIL